MVRTGRGSGLDVRKQEMLYVNIAAYIINNVNNVPVGPLPRPVLTNPNPLHHPRVLPARNGQCRIHAWPEWTRPLTGAGIEAARRPRERRPRRFRVHAAAPRSKVAIAGYNMHVKSSWESVVQLAVLPQLVNLFQ